MITNRSNRDRPPTFDEPAVEPSQIGVPDAGDKATDLDGWTSGDTDDGDDSGFNERRYLIAFPDIAAAVERGEIESAHEHYAAHGRSESRLNEPAYLNAIPDLDSPHFPAGDIDAAFITRDGWLLVIGWLNDDPAPLSRVACLEDDHVICAAGHAARCRREDAETAIRSVHGKLLGFWTVLRAKAGLDFTKKFRIRLWAGTESKTFSVEPKFVDPQKLRELSLEYFASTQYFANKQTESVDQLGNGLGEILISLNKEITSTVTDGAYVMRFGQLSGPKQGSLIVCLYGRAEYLFLQAALFSQYNGARGYEFIFVSNSPELAEQLVKEATIASRIYDVAITLVILPSNAGFGAANNIAVGYARSRRVLIVNPDVFPRDRSWAAEHSKILSGLPVTETKIFGVPLYYDDGSLMHGGMYFDMDTGVSIRSGQVQSHQILRVEHYGKGAPPTAPAFLKSRRVPAVTGAFISVDRGWFEHLGGFSTEYVFGHYEDADLCLKSQKSGQSVWVHDLPFWHLEGKGSTRRPMHEGGSTLNRWHFTETWKDFISNGLLGKQPSQCSP